MKTTLGDIMKFSPCGQKKGSGIGWDKLVSFLGTDDLDTEVTFRQILKSNGLDDTLWALRTQPYRDYCLFLAEVAESVLYIFEKENPNDDRPRKAIEGIRDYHSGKISLDELKELESDGRNAAWAASDAEWAASRASWAAGAAGAAARAAARDAARDAARAAARAAASDAARAARAAWAAGAAGAAGAAARAASSAVARAAGAAKEYDKKFEEIEEILLKYI